MDCSLAIKASNTSRAQFTIRRIIKNMGNRTRVRATMLMSNSLKFPVILRGKLTLPIRTSPGVKIIMDKMLIHPKALKTSKTIPRKSKSWNLPLLQ
ncbi:hypothetical protein H5410_036743 [Solanum commersonii]|uniref:Uncharacterized protein n=1 Tax=Solanum commersonii TaxID=4109 RepID=A0A9J5Y6I6_SOLCO|nr:hypothetical protein H5410_036743 [Solanum commersonii]